MMAEERDILAEHEAYVEQWVHKLTKPQQRILNQMRWEGYFIVSRTGEFAYWLVTPKLDVVQRVDPRTVTALEPLHIERRRMGKFGEHGSLYIAHEYMRHWSILRCYEVSCEAEERRKEQGKE